jgi:hypothetical protein
MQCALKEKTIQHMRDILEMPTVLKPGSTRADVFSSWWQESTNSDDDNDNSRVGLTALALALDQHRQIGWLEQLQQLEAITLGIYGNFDACMINQERLEGILTRVISMRRQFLATRVREFERLAVGTLECLCEGAEGE